MLSKSHRNLTLIGAIVLSASCPAHAFFIGDFRPKEWEVNSASSNPGMFSFDGTGGNEIMAISGSTIPGPSDTIISLKSPFSRDSGSLTFSWSIQNNGNVGGAQAYFYYGVGSPILLGNGDSSGTVTFADIPANTEIDFDFSAMSLAGKIPPILRIHGWQFNRTVPDTATLLVDIIPLGLMLTVNFYRRRKRPSAELVSQ